SVTGRAASPVAEVSAGRDRHSTHEGEVHDKTRLRARRARRRGPGDGLLARQLGPFAGGSGQVRCDPSVSRQAGWWGAEEEAEQGARAAQGRTIELRAAHPIALSGAYRRWIGRGGWEGIAGRGPAATPVFGAWESARCVRRPPPGCLDRP